LDWPEHEKRLMTELGVGRLGEDLFVDLNNELIGCALQVRNGRLAPNFSALHYVRQRTDMF
jgi:hypothetical protein